MELHCASSSFRVATLPSCSRRTQRPLIRSTSRMAGVQASQASRREHQSMVRSSSPMTTSTSTSSSSLFLATAAAAALLLCSSLFVSPASAADFVSPGAMVEQLHPPPSRAQGLARSRRAGGSGAPSPSPSPSPPASIELLSGRVRVADGDTVEITSDAPDGTTTKHKVRIWGIDAPETKQLCGRDNNECGKRATERMRQVLGETATCEVKARDQYGRAVARCFPGIRSEKELDDDDDDAVVDAGLELITSGDAVAYSKYSKGFYEPFEKVARENKVGIWAGEFEMPEDWRRQQRIKMLQGVAAQRAASPAAASPEKSAGGGPPPALNPKPSRPSSPTPAPTRTSSSHKEGEEHEAGCDIKGNISSKNAKLFHLPGSLFYDAVKIDEARGERWFCSEEEAREAGWEKARYGGRPPSQKDKEKAGSDEGGSDGGATAAPSTDAEVEAAADDEEGEEGAHN